MARCCNTMWELNTASELWFQDEIHVNHDYRVGGENVSVECILLMKLQHNVPYCIKVAFNFSLAFLGLGLKFAVGFKTSIKFTVRVNDTVRVMVSSAPRLGLE